MSVKQEHDGPRTENFTPRNAPLPACAPNAGCFWSRRAAPVQPVHRHESAFELLYVRRGGQKVLLDGKLHIVSRGAVFVVKPGERHGGVRKILQPCEACWLIVDMSVCRREFGEDFAAVADALATIERRTFPAGAGVAEQFQVILDECAGPRDAFGASRISAAIKTLLTLMARRYRDHIEKEKRRAVSGDRAIREAVEWVNARLAENWTVEEAAAAARIKPSRFYALFTEKTGRSPVEYRNLARVEQAKTLLSDTDREITDIAFSLGFCSSQYFAGVFKKLEGVTPSRYRKEFRRDCPTHRTCRTRRTCQTCRKVDSPS